MGNNSIKILRNTVSRRIVTENISLTARFAISKKSLFGWVAFEELIFPARGFGKGLIMVVDDRSGVPISPYFKPKVEDADKAETARQSYAYDNSNDEVQKHKAFQSDMLVFGILGLIAGIIVIALLQRGG